MFNSYHAHAGNNTTNNSLKINAVSGAILKNHPNSWFERFHLKSDRAKTLLCEGGHEATITEKHYRNNDVWDSYTTTRRAPEKDIIILQMMVCGDMEVIAECVYKNDYEGEISNAE